jgi:hypothetical protein
MSTDDRKAHGLVAVGVPIAKITRPVFGRRGFIHGALASDWPAIVGSALAGQTLPLSVRFPKGERTGGVLEIKVAASAFSTQLQHLAPLVIERVNGYFGWKAVDRIKLRHGPLPRLGEKKPPKKQHATPTDPVVLPDALESIDNPELKAALQRLASHLTPGVKS